MADNKEFNPDIYTLVDEEGVEQVFELLDVMEVGDDRYFALTPYYDDPEEMLSSDCDIIVLKSQMDENDEELMVSVDDEEEYQRIGNMFLEKLADIFNSDFDDEE